MKILLVGASSDIAVEFYNTHNVNYNIIRLSSNPDFSDIQDFNVQDENSFIDEDNIDGIIYFPGSINLKPFKRLKIENFREDFEINVVGLLKILKFYESRLSEKSSLVFISTVAANLGMPFHSSVSVSKSAIEGLTKSLAAEWAPKVRVNCIAPSLVETKLAKRFFRTEDQKEMMNQKHPLKRTGLPEDIVNALDFLISNKSSWISGQILNVDGGMSTLKI
ncbi:MAG: SDR family NAD(P)-dependent oxidoreductase [Flavobacteriales bacterium]|jgi:3-oxoacyl-[acyl-carrier protein] reductase|tara:strand:+ start:6397 stop:7059 length:663 start_codon:yes stop_codon:yes gene_type:complete